MQDSLPFNGLFNQLIGDNAVNITNVGLRIMSDSTFIASIHEKVDKMLNQRNKKTIYFRQTGTGSQRIYSGSTFY
jgi:hypothetical protein